jgi:hypothetical protein
MLLIGVDYHASFQQVAFLNLDTGECGELRLIRSQQVSQLSLLVMGNGPRLSCNVSQAFCQCFAYPERYGGFPS